MQLFANYFFCICFFCSFCDLCTKKKTNRFAKMLWMPSSLCLINLCFRPHLLYLFGWTDYYLNWTKLWVHILQRKTAHCLSSLAIFLVSKSRFFAHIWITEYTQWRKLDKNRKHYSNDVKIYLKLKRLKRLNNLQNSYNKCLKFICFDGIYVFQHVAVRSVSEVIR